MSKTALFKAAAEWDAPTVTRLLSEKPQLVKIRDGRGRSPLHVCALKRWDRQPESGRASIATAKALLANGADLNDIWEIPDDGEIFPGTPLWAAVAWGINMPLIKFFLSLGANADHCLHAVAWANDAPLARMLLKAGSRTELVFGGETPLHYAARLRREDVVKELVAGGADIHAKDHKGRTALDLALKKKLSAPTLKLLGPQAPASKPLRKSTSGRRTARRA